MYNLHCTTGFLINTAPGMFMLYDTVVYFFMKNFSNVFPMHLFVFWL